MAGDIIESSMPNKWEYLGEFLKAKIKNVDWKKQDIKKLTRNGLKLDSDYLKGLDYTDLGEYLSAFQKSGGNKLEFAGKTFSDAFKRDIKFWDDFVEGDKLGAAIGLFFVPPVGTAVGTIAGVVGVAGDSVGIADVNDGGRKIAWEIW